MNGPDGAPRPIWIDTDIIFNRFAQDVDDGLALMAALDSPRVAVRGISLMRGVANGARVTRRLLGAYARYPVPVYAGADDIFAGHGQRSEAVDRLAEALETERLRILAIGTAVNLANLLLFYPELAGRIDEIVFCAGRQAGASFLVPGARPLPLPDANFDNDPASMRRVLEAGIPITLVGFEAAAPIQLDGRDIARIRRNGRREDRWVARRLELWRLAWRLKLRLPAFVPFDACTLAHLLYPELLSYHRDIPLVIRHRANDAPRWKAGESKEYLEVSYDDTSPWRVDFAHAIDPRYKEILMNHLLGTPP